MTSQTGQLFGAVCNTAPPRLQSQVRGLDSGAKLATRVVRLDDVTNGSLTDSAALEIIVSPRI